jgi:hypothetical protein
MPQGMTESPEFAYNVCHEFPLNIFDSPRGIHSNSTG